LKNYFLFYKNILKYGNLFLIVFIFFSCIDPIPPVFDFKENLIIINALATTVPGTTNITVDQTIIEFGEYKSKFISGCAIDLINSDTKERFSFVEQDKVYIIS